jgi:hypothetical protein
MSDYIKKCVRFKGTLKEVCKEGENYIVHFMDGALYIPTPEIEWLAEKGDDVDRSIVLGLKCVNRAEFEKINIEL